MSPLLIVVLVVVAVFLGLATWRAPRLTSTLFWSLTATIMTMVAIADNSPGETREALMFGVVLMPVLWAAFQFWCYWERSKWRVAGGMIAITSISSVAFFAL
ncbi:MAG: hypothetical protein AAGI89_06870 [Pseudomonadota bacterium]